MLRSKRSFLVALSIALGVLAMALVDSLDLVSQDETPEAVHDTMVGNRTRPRPQPKSGNGEASKATSDDVGIPAILVPGDTALYVELASIATVERTIRRMVGEVDPMLAMNLDADMMLGQMLGMFGADPASIDKRRPLGVALSMPKNGDPCPTLILPVHAPTKFQRSLQLPPGFADPRITAGYVGLALGEAYPPAGAPLPLGFAPTTLNVYFDLNPMRDEIQSGMRGARGIRRPDNDPRGAAAYDFGQEVAEEVISSISSFEFALDAESDSIGMQVGVELLPGSTFARPSISEAPELKALARFASDQDDVYFVAGWNRAFFEEGLRPLIDRVAEFAQTDEEEASFDKIEQALAFLPSIGDQAAVFASTEPGAAHVVLVCRPADPGTLLGMAGMAFTRIDRESLPFQLGPLETVETDEDGAAQLRAARAVIDLGAAREGEDSSDVRIRGMLAHLFGDSQVELQLSAVGDYWIATLGADPAWRDELLARATSEEATSVDPKLAELLASTEGASPACAYRVDAKGIAADMVTLFAEHMELDPTTEVERIHKATGQEPVWIEGYMAAFAQRWESGTEIDFDRLLTLIEIFE